MGRKGPAAVWNVKLDFSSMVIPKDPEKNVIMDMGACVEVGLLIRLREPMPMISVLGREKVKISAYRKLRSDAD
jgi:hypothetical protein